MKTGVRQGDVLAPVTFSHFLDVITAANRTQHASLGVKMLDNREDSLVESRKIMREVGNQDLEYADDMTLVSDFMVLCTLLTTYSSCLLAARRP